MGSIAVVIGGGSIEPSDTHFEVVIAADSGLDAALAVGLEPTVLIGDLDSISAAGLEWANARGITIERHRADKDDTDTALALRHAATLAGTHGERGELVVLGAASLDRFDHQLGTLSALGDPMLEPFASVRAHLGRTVVHVVHPEHCVDMRLADGEVFSLLALHGRCDGIAVDGARWPLRHASLQPGQTLGISNEALGGTTTVQVGSGVLTVIVPRSVAP